MREVPPPAAVIIPTAGRPGYLDVALASIAPQVAALDADLLVVDDGPSDETRAAARRHGARYVAHEHGRGLNAARNTGIRETEAPLLCFVDDDVEAHAGWLAALVSAARDEPDDVWVLTGPILARFDGVTRRVCGRELPPITHLDLGDQDSDAPHAWGANMTIRRGALDLAGPFDEALGLYGDEEEWQDRVRAAGGRIRYIAAAALDHRRAGDDAKPAALRRAAYSRGRASRRFDRLKGRSPGLGAELKTLAACAAHGPRFRCANGPVMAAHSAGRVREAMAERLGYSVPPEAPGVDDFLSGRSGVATGRSALLLRARDVASDLRAVTARRRRRKAAGSPAPQRVLTLSVERTDVPSILDAALAELRRSRHHVTVARADASPGVGKFERLNELLSEHDLGQYDWVLVIDDDVALPRCFLDTFLAAAEDGALTLAQPAHRRHSHAAWPVTIRSDRSDWRTTNFVEIGPVTAFSRTAVAELLPFPKGLGMGWGLDVHWSAIAAERGWRLGVVDATPVTHTLRVTAADYPREQAAAAALDFLAERPYTPRSQVRTLSAHRFGEPR